MRMLYFDRQGHPISQARWFDLMCHPRHVAHDDLGRLGRVSTVWLGIDHGWGTGPPLIFETLVFGGPLAEEMERYSTLEEARYGHEFMLMRLTSLRAECREARRPALFHNGRKPRR
jgi:hypothetical protein